MSDPVKLNDRVFGFLRDSADSEPLYKSMQANLHSLFEYVDSVQGRFRETLNAKDVQYLLAFKEHMTSTTMQIEQLRRELQSKQRLDMSVKAIELLQKDVNKLRFQCDVLNKEREQLSDSNKRFKSELQECKEELAIYKSMLLKSQAENQILREDLSHLKKAEYDQLLPKIKLQTAMITAPELTASTREYTIRSREHSASINKEQGQNNVRRLRHMLKPRESQNSRRIRPMNGNMVLNMSAGY